MELSSAFLCRRGVLGLLFLLLLPVCQPDDHSFASSTGLSMKDFSEVGDLPSASTLVAHEITPRKGAGSSKSSEEKTLGGEVSQKEPKKNDVSSLTLDKTTSGVQGAVENATISSSVNSSNIPLAASNVSSTTSSPNFLPKASLNLTTPVSTKKGKPGLTFDEGDLPRDENGKPLYDNLTGSEPLFDYVVPIVVAMLAVPFIVVIGAISYKKIRDFWDRRHYRRMDFLIDGMYND